jgi:hypothetical protein
MPAPPHSINSSALTIRRTDEADAAAGLSPGELAVVKRCLRRIYSNMKNRPAAAGRSRQTHFRLWPARRRET